MFRIWKIVPNMPIFTSGMTESNIHPSAPLYFLSDVHLGVGSADEERIKQRRLLTLFQRIRQTRARLYIVGDLFDFWYEYRHALPRGHHRILAALEELRDAGIEIAYLAGNHDFAIGRFFSSDLGIAVVRDDLEFHHDGKSFYLYHGDGLALKDTGYKILKAVLRNRLAQWAFRWLHPDLGFALAHATSHGSRKYTQNKNYGANDGMLIEARKRIAAGADFVIMGHRHKPLKTPIGDGIYVNLGDWMRHFSFAVYENKEIRLYTIRDDDFHELDVT